jgi:hypothetical protein
MDPRYILAIIAQVSSPSLQELLFEFPVTDGYNVECVFDWQGVADLLSRPQFANLKRVGVKWRLCPGSHRSDVEALFAEGPFAPITRRSWLKLEFLTTPGAHNSWIDCEYPIDSTYFDDTDPEL